MSSLMFCCTQNSILAIFEKYLTNGPTDQWTHGWTKPLKEIGGRILKVETKGKRGKGEGARRGRVRQGQG